MRDGALTISRLLTKFREQNSAYIEGEKLEKDLVGDNAQLNQDTDKSLKEAAKPKPEEVKSADEILAVLNAREVAARREAVAAKSKDAEAKLDAEDKAVENFFTALQAKLEQSKTLKEANFASKVCSDLIGTADTKGVNQFDPKKIEDMPEFKAIKNSETKAYILKQLGNKGNPKEVGTLFALAVAQGEDRNTKDGDESPHAQVTKKLTEIKDGTMVELKKAREVLKNDGYYVEPEPVETKLTVSNLNAILQDKLIVASGVQKASFFRDVNKKVKDIKFDPETGQPSDTIKLSQLGVKVTGAGDRPLNVTEIKLLQELSGRVIAAGNNGTLANERAEYATAMISAIVGNLSVGTPTEPKPKQDKKNDKLLRTEWETDKEMAEIIGQNPELKESIRKLKENKRYDGSALPSATVGKGTSATRRMAQ